MRNSVWNDAQFPAWIKVCSAENSLKNQNTQKRMEDVWFSFDTSCLGILGKLRSTLTFSERKLPQHYISNFNILVTVTPTELMIQSQFSKDGTISRNIGKLLSIRGEIEFGSSSFTEDGAKFTISEVRWPWAKLACRYRRNPTPKFPSCFILV